TGALFQEGAAIYTRISSGEVNVGRYLEQMLSALPPSVHAMLDRFGVGDIFSLREKLTTGALQGSKFLATQAVNVGQNTFEFLIGMGVMLYILYFLLRDGANLARTSRQLIPLSDEH